MKTQFKETQKFTQWWLWTLFVGLIIFPFIWMYLEQLEVKNDTYVWTLDRSVIVYLGAILLLILLFVLLRLKTTINTAGIQMHYFPFVRKNIGWRDIESVKVIDYGFVGGWGIRVWTSYGTVYNVKGSKGLFITLNSGKKLVIGTQKPIELDEYLQKLHP